MLRNVTLICVGLLLANSQLRSEELINWHENLTTARQISQQYRVPILIHFYGDQCMPCKTLEKNVFTRPEVASTMQRYFVPVRINATHDRRTAAEFGVHSWPTDVFVSPDGKTLMQGVCNQNPNNYLQNLQNVALMNRDRNAMLAGNNQAQPTTSGASPYGRTASNNLQQSAPGRDAAPTPYSNPSSGANPYAQNAPANSLASTQFSGSGQSSMPSPSWQGQSAGGQATNGQLSAGPLPNGNTMTVHPSQPASSQANKTVNVPPTVQWQTNQPMHSQSAFSQSNAPTIAQAPTLPLAPAMTQPQTASQSSSRGTAFASDRPATGRDSIVNNPHFANTPASVTSSASTQPQTGAPTAQSMPNANSAGSAPSNGVHGQLVSSSSSSNRPALAPDPNSLSKATVSVPALGGYCPVALLGEPSSWIKGSEQFAIRHRGRVYFLSSEETAKQFLATPDAFTPVLSGHDPLVFLREGRLVDGSIYDGVLKDRQHIMLFSSEANKTVFYENYDRLVSELELLIQQGPK
ncbi:MAG: thioredoxin family protein [Pirellulaceae bacterium]|nr:thioredoxin family protein [Pirellulaceae bacterium]